MADRTDTVMDIYQAFGRGDVPFILERLSDDVRWDEGLRPTGLSYLEPGVGKAHVQRFFGELAGSVAFSVFEPLDVCVGADTVLVAVREQGCNLRTGATIDEDVVAHLWRFDEAGKVCAFRHIGDFALHERAAVDRELALDVAPVPAVGSRLGVLGDTITVLQAGGEFEVFDMAGPDQSGPPPHAHPWSESYLVLAGRVEVSADSVRVLEAGEFLEVPGGTLHSFRLLGEGCRMLVMTSGDRASRFFADVDRSVPAGPPDQSTMAAVLDVAKRNGLTSPLFA